MILHKDGSIEGTPEELHQYTKLQEKKEPFKVIPPTKLIISDYPTTNDYVRGLLSAIGKGYYH